MSDTAAVSNMGSEGTAAIFTDLSSVCSTSTSLTASCLTQSAAGSPPLSAATWEIAVLNTWATRSGSAGACPSASAWSTRSSFTISTAEVRAFGSSSNLMGMGTRSASQRRSRVAPPV